MAALRFRELPDEIKRDFLGNGDISDKLDYLIEVNEYLPFPKRCDFVNELRKIIKEKSYNPQYKYRRELRELLDEIYGKKEKLSAKGLYCIKDYLPVLIQK